MLKTYDDFFAEAQEYKNILTKYKNTGEVFTDPNFHPTAEIKEYRYSFSKNHVWKRIDEYYKAPLFKPEAIDSNFIKQGELGDCYFLSALSRLARQPDLVESLFDDQSKYILGEEKDSINIKCGAVVIYFHAFGRETPVLIDTLIPFKRGTRTPRFSHPTDLNVSPWFCLVEKAYAKLNGTYTSIDGGTLPGAIYSLFGYFPDVRWVNQLKQPRKVRKMSPFDRLMKYQRKGSVMGAAIHLQYLTKGITQEDLLDLGLITGHSYVVMKVRNQSGINFVCLRNPWGGHEWLGDWSDTSEKWTDELKEALGMQESEDGSFWMDDKDFLNYFNKIDISRPIPPEYNSKIFFMQMEPGPHDGKPVSSAEANVANRTNYAIEITEPIRKGEKCKLYIIIERRRQSFDPATKQYINPTQFTTVIMNTKGQKITPDVYNHTSDAQVITTPQDLIGITQLVRANRHIYTVFVQRIQKSPYTEDCYIQVFCKYQFKIYNIDNPAEVIQDVQTGGIAFDNYSVLHPDIAPKLLKKKVGRKVVSSIYTESKEETKEEESKLVAKPVTAKVGSDDEEEEEEIHVTKEELDKAKAKAEEEAKAKEKAEEEAKAAMEEVNRLKAQMKEMEEKIAEREKKLKEESDKEKQDKLEKELEAEKSLYETSKITFKKKKKSANNLCQKAQKKKNELDEADKYASYLLDSFKPEKKPKITLKVKNLKEKIEIFIPGEKNDFPKSDSDSDSDPKPKKSSTKLSASSDSDDEKPSKTAKKLSTSSDDDDDKPLKAKKKLTSSSSASASGDEEPVKAVKKPEKTEKPEKPEKTEKPKEDTDDSKPKKTKGRSTGIRRYIPKTKPV